MKRDLIKQLSNWKTKSNRKPLILRGARQVGKTWLMKSFGEQTYKQVAYTNFESNKRLQNIFDNDFDINRILLAIQIETGIVISATDTLIIFDEIQEAPKAITSLKYFYENAPQYHIIAAGSLLGVAVRGEVSFPVGKVDFLDLYPLGFLEFLEGIGELALVNLLYSKNWELITTFKTKTIELLRLYYYIGGMPEVVQAFTLRKDLNEVREIQHSIIQSYEQDFSKHAPKEIIPRIQMVWNSIPSQLAKENKKFIFGLIKDGARAKEFELAIRWLVDAGLLHQINKITKPEIPLIAYEDLGSFKLYMNDVGLLNAKGNIDAKSLLNGNEIFNQFKGAISEQFVLQQLVTIKNLPIYYWSNSSSTAELDFIVQHNGVIIPIEVKAEENLKAKSLKVFIERFNPEVSIRTSLSDYRKESKLTNVPLYSIGTYFLE